MKSLVFLKKEDLNKPFKYDVQNTCFVYIVRDEDDWIILHDMEKKFNINLNVFNIEKIYKSILEFNAFNSKFKLDPRNVELNLTLQIENYFESHLCDDNSTKI